MPPPEVQKLIDYANSSGKGKQDRKHHVVPKVYLKRWASNGQLRVTDLLNNRRSFTQGPGVAGRVTDFYREESPNIDPTEIPPLFLEKLYALAEDRGAPGLEALTHSQPWDIAPEIMGHFLWFISFQVTRGQAFRFRHREMTVATYRTMLSELSDDEIIAMVGPGSEDPAKILAGVREIREGRIGVYAETPLINSHALQGAAELGRHFFGYDWCVYSTTTPLITCDEPIIRVPAIGSARDERPGIASAGVILFPISPFRLLVLFPKSIGPEPQPWTLSVVETNEINHEILAAAHRWAFELPERHVTERMYVPLELPGLETEQVQQSGPGRPSMTRFFECNRWRFGVAPPLPVERWWHRYRVDAPGPVLTVPRPRPTD